MKSRDKSSSSKRNTSGAIEFMAHPNGGTGADIFKLEYKPHSAGLKDDATTAFTVPELAHAETSESPLENREKGAIPAMIASQTGRTDANPAVLESEIRWRVVHAYGRANVRQQPTLKAPITGTLPYGQVLIQLDRIDDFINHSDGWTKCFDTKGDPILDRVDQSLQRGPPTLLELACEGDSAAIASFLDSKANVNASDKNGMSPLLAATSNGHTDAMNVLLSSKAEIEARSKYGTTSVMVAASRGHNAALSLLLEQRANVDAKDVDGDTPAIIASQKGHTQNLALLLSNKANIDAASKVQQLKIIKN